MKNYTEPCCAANHGCLSPANLDDRRPLRLMCFCCGQKVCANCSSMIEYLTYGKVRICDNCKENAIEKQAQ